METRKIHHLIGTIGKAECGQPLRSNHSSGVDHVAESARGLLAWIDQYGTADVCEICPDLAAEALRRRGVTR